VKVRDVCRAVEELAPLALAYAWDKPGLRIGDPDAEVSHVLVALTVTRAAYERARAVGAQMIVSHHPPLWEPLATLRTDDPAVRLLVDLAHDGIACYAAHTNLDLAPGGVNDALAARLGLANRRPLLPAPQGAQVKLVTFVPESHLAAVRDAVCAAGAGVIGEYTHCSFSAPGTGTFLPGEAAQPFSGEKHRVNEEPERRFETLVQKARLPRVLEALFGAHPYEEPAYDVVPLENTDRSIGLGVRGELAEPLALDRFAAAVRAALELDHVRVAGDPARSVRSVAVIGGAGGGEAARVPRDVDVLVTGDVGYHAAVDAVERGLALIDAGHDGTERGIVSELARYLSLKLPPLQATAFGEPTVLRLAL